MEMKNQSAFRKSAVFITIIQPIMCPALLREFFEQSTYHAFPKRNGNQSGELPTAYA